MTAGPLVLAAMLSCVPDQDVRGPEGSTMPFSIISPNYKGTVIGKEVI